MGTVMRGFESGASGRQSAFLSSASALVVAGSVIAVMVRGLAWIATLFVEGPLFGPAEFAITGRATAPVAIADGCIALVALVFAVIAGLSERVHPAGMRSIVNRLAWFFLIDNVVYIAGVVSTALFRLQGRESPGPVMLVGEVAANLALLCIALRLIWLTGRRRAQ
jgi:hypothetical protein